MRSRYKIDHPGEVYFLTATVIEWIPALNGPEERALLIDALAYCRREKGLRLYAYVIMDNHLHLLAQAPDLSRTIQSVKRHTARQLIALFQQRGQSWLLNQFAYHKKNYKDESDHQFWQEGTHPQRIEGDAMLAQKIDYIHDNPVRRGWVDLPEHWRHSSARNYVTGDQTVLEIDFLT